MTRDFAPLLVVGFVGTRRGDADRGPLIRLRPDDAAARLIADGDLVWVYGPRRHELAPVALDESLPRGGVVLRDIAGIAVSEIVRLVTRDVAQRPVLTSRLT
ncbi:MAG: molybdopterin dinucleotide binding domain-containing protein [Gemmatimonadaceae bacterium]